jgi:hypothetical protein
MGPWLRGASLLLAAVLAILAGCSEDKPRQARHDAAPLRVEAGAVKTLGAKAAWVRMRFRSPSTEWRASGSADLGARQYLLIAEPEKVRKASLARSWGIYGSSEGVFWGYNRRGDTRAFGCLVDGILPGGSFGGALSTERAMGLLEAYLRLLARHVREAKRLGEHRYAVELDPAAVVKSRSLERDAGGFGGRLAGRLIAPRAPILVRLDRNSSVAEIRLRLEPARPESRDGIPPHLARRAEPSTLRLGFPAGHQDRIYLQRPHCLAIE